MAAHPVGHHGEHSAAARLGRLNDLGAILVALAVASDVGQDCGRDLKL
jgi:hypothetical protein